jgi:hypothetical protein
MDAAEGVFKSFEKSCFCSAARKRSNCWRASVSCRSRSCTCLRTSEEGALLLPVGLLDGGHAPIGVFCELAANVTTRTFRATRCFRGIALQLFSDAVVVRHNPNQLTLTLRSLQASQLGSFLLWRYARFGLCIIIAEM